VARVADLPIQRGSGWRTARFALVAAASIAAAMAAPGAALAQKDKDPPPAAVAVQKARAEIVVLHATNDHTGIDPKIGKMPELAKPPFSSYDSYKLLDRVEVNLTRGSAEQKKLPDDGQLAVTLKEILAAEKKGDPPRFAVSAKIQKPGGKSFLPALEVSAKKGEIFFVAGQRYKGGILVVGIRILG
jgi:hypothetical protein